MTEINEKYSTEPKYAKIRCPKCGATDIVEWLNVPTKSFINFVELDQVDQDDPDSIETFIHYSGTSEGVWEVSKVTGYSCINYCYEGSLEDFIAKE